MSFAGEEALAEDAYTGEESLVEDVCAGVKTLVEGAYADEEWEILMMLK